MGTKVFKIVQKSSDIFVVSLNDNGIPKQQTYSLQGLETVVKNEINKRAGERYERIKIVYDAIKEFLKEKESKKETKGGKDVKAGK